MMTSQRFLSIALVSATSCLPACALSGHSGTLQVFQPLELSFDDKAPRTATLQPDQYSADLVWVSEDCLVFKLPGREGGVFTVDFDSDVLSMPMAGGSIDVPFGKHNQNFEVQGEYSIDASNVAVSTRSTQFARYMRFQDFAAYPYAGTSRGVITDMTARTYIHSFDVGMNLEFGDAQRDVVLASFRDHTRVKAQPSAYTAARCH
jgi:hypothetical protein